MITSGRRAGLLFRAAYVQCSRTKGAGGIQSTMRLGPPEYKEDLPCRFGSSPGNAAYYRAVL
jgi:hypothetical protein